jgi:hypothetical protein
VGNGRARSDQNEHQDHDFHFHDIEYLGNNNMIIKLFKPICQQEFLEAQVVYPSFPQLGLAAQEQ